MASKAYYSFGKDIFGPFLLCFVRWLHREVKERGLQKVVFLSRDGYMMQKAFDIICPTSDGIRISYAYFSRNSIRRCRLNHCETYKDTIELFNCTARYTSVAELFSFYGIHRPEFEKCCSVNNSQLTWETPLNSARLRTNSEVKKIYGFFADSIREDSVEQEKLLHAYSVRMGMEGSFALVDIGWYGSMQKYIEMILPAQTSQLKGFYVGINSRGTRNEACGWVFSDADSPLRKSVFAFFGVIEKLFQSQEGSTDRYKLDEQQNVVPVLLDYEYEKGSRIVSDIITMQDGALDFVREHRDDDSIDEKQVINSFLSFGTNPSKRHLELFKEFYNTDGERVCFLPIKPLYRYSLCEFKRDLAKSPWKTGFLKAAFRLPLPYLSIYSLLKK